eukprot:13735528-Ditylum_brightwellii.AAC.1
MSSFSVHLFLGFSSGPTRQMLCNEGGGEEGMVLFGGEGVEIRLACRAAAAPIKPFPMIARSKSI